MILICFHCAGCDSSMFTARVVDRQRVGNTLVDYCQNQHITLVCPNFNHRAGKNNRKLSDVNLEVASIIEEEFLDRGNGRPDRDLNKADWAMVGHSMGGVAAYAFYYQMRQRRLCREPKFVILSSSWDDTMGARPWPVTSSLSDEALKEEMVNAWGMSPRVAESAELWNMVKNRVRGDMEMLEAYEPYPALPVSFPVVHVAGTDDHYITPELVAKHKRWLTDNYTLQTLAGANHAIYHNATSRAEMFALIIAQLQKTDGRGASSDDDSCLVDCF